MLSRLGDSPFPVVWLIIRDKNKFPSLIVIHITLWSRLWKRWHYVWDSSRPSASLQLKTQNYGTTSINGPSREIPVSSQHGHRSENKGFTDKIDGRYCTNACISSPTPYYFNSFKNCLPRHRFYIPYILESNPHPFYSFRWLKNQIRIRIACGLDSRSRAGFWKNDRAAVRAVRTIQ
jgi:hypothetical protein